MPKTLGVIGSGVIGLEMGSVWRRLGAEVTVLEALPTFLGAVDEQIAKEAHKAFTKQGLKIELGVKIGEVKTGKKGVAVAYTDAKGGAQTLACDKLIVSIGRVPNTTGLNAEAVGLKLDERGFVDVDAECRTNLPNVWAVGDVVRGPMLAHKAEEEGVAVAERIAGQHGHVNFNTIPWVIYTSPEIAWVGQTEQQLKAARSCLQGRHLPVHGQRPRAGARRHDRHGEDRWPMPRPTRSSACTSSGRWLSELIAEAVVAMEFRASSEDIARICHAHPSLAEATKEAALAVDKRDAELLIRLQRRAAMTVRELYQRRAGRARLPAPIRRSCAPSTRWNAARASGPDYKARRRSNALTQADRAARRSRAACTCTAASGAARAS